MLHRLNLWCARWCLTINTDKSKVIHFRPPSIERAVHAFKCGMSTLEIVSQYKYLLCYSNGTFRLYYND